MLLSYNLIQLKDLIINNNVKLVLAFWVRKWLIVQIEAIIYIWLGTCPGHWSGHDSITRLDL